MKKGKYVDLYGNNKLTNKKKLRNVKAAQVFILY